MYSIKRLGPVLTIVGLILLTAVCAMGQAEVDPDHFDRSSAHPAVSTNKARSPRGLSAPVHRSPHERQVEGQDTAKTIADHTVAPRSSVESDANVTNQRRKTRRSVARKHPRVVLEARRHGSL